MKFARQRRRGFLRGAPRRTSSLAATGHGPVDTTASTSFSGNGPRLLCATCTGIKVRTVWQRYPVSAPRRMSSSGEARRLRELRGTRFEIELISPAPKSPRPPLSVAEVWTERGYCIPMLRRENARFWPEEGELMACAPRIKCPCEDEKEEEDEEEKEEEEEEEEEERGEASSGERGAAAPVGVRKGL
ncbi:hypothetical protein KM043_010879 [Ampulex compressa]|nr:hypothetical protein KM043_010879 [Ampulex compressa]